MCETGREAKIAKGMIRRLGPGERHILFSAAVLDHNSRPRNVGGFEGATHQGQSGVPGDGPYVVLWLRVENGSIRRAGYSTYGCPAAVASASVAAEVLQGRTVRQALSLEPRDVELLLGGLPEGKGHCAAMVVEALRDALSRKETN